MGLRLAGVLLLLPVPRVPFPVHIQALVGSLAVLWLFLAVAHYARRAGLL